MKEILIKSNDEYGTHWYREELIQCKNCKYLDAINSNAVYARCEKHNIDFLLFEDDTRECFCSWAERKEE